MDQGFFAPFGNRLEAVDADSLRGRLAKIDRSVSGRAEERSSNHHERYALTLFLRSLLIEDRLRFPIKITKREKPDFQWEEAGEVRGLEIVNGGSESHHKALSELAKSPPGSALFAGDTKPRGKGEHFAEPMVRPLAGDEPERRWTEEILARVQEKTDLLQSYDPDLRTRCDLLIYDNTEWAGLIGWHADELPHRLATAIQEWRAASNPKNLQYRSISVVREQLVLHDVGGKGKLVLHDVTGETTIMASSRAAEVLRLSHFHIAEFCRRHGIRKLGFFGSIHEPERFGPGSDVDVLVEFQPEERVGLIRLAGIEIELSELVQLKVDLRSVPDLSRYFRDEVTRQNTELEYVATAP